MEVGGMLKLNRQGRPPTGQSEEALRFRRRFRFAATKVPFSEVVDFPVLNYGSLSTRFLKEERNEGEIAGR